MMVSVDNCLLPIDVRQAVLTIQKWTVTKPATCVCRIPAFLDPPPVGRSFIDKMWSDTFHNTFIQIHPNSAFLASRFLLADAMKTLSIASRVEAQHKVVE